jgi:ribosomal protein S18 acetylase RimI-like enzyme
LLLARDPAGEALGCIALKPLCDGACEIKRLYVRPQARGLGLGRALAVAVIDAAERIGYREIKLDTLESMTSAIALYRGLGFEPIPDYGTTPYPGLLCFGKRLPASGCG